MMAGFFAWLAGSRIGKWAIAAASFFAFCFFVFLSIFRKGEKAGEAKVNQANTQAVQKAQEQANEVQAKVAADEDGEAARALEEKWTHK